MILYQLSRLHTWINHQLLTRGLVFLYVGVLILVPLAALFWKATQRPLAELWPLVVTPIALDAYRLTFGTALAAALINSVFGGILAWILVRYDFPGKRWANGLVDLPLAIPGVVVGITLMSLYAPGGVVGQWLDPGTPIGILLQQVGIAEVNLTSSVLGILLAQVFVTLPFIVRTVQPVLIDFEPEVEEAARLLGASPWQCFWRVIFPQILPALLTGFTLALARGIGEFGIAFIISGNIPHETLISTVYIYQRLEQFDYSGATAVAIVLLTIAIAFLGCAGVLQRWSQRHTQKLTGNI